MDQIRHRAHLNLVDSSRQLFELDPGATIEAADGWLLGAGSSGNPAISNAVFRVDDALEPAELLGRAREFFGERGRGFSVWTRGEEAEDRDLVAAAREGGLEPFFEMPEMVLGGGAEEVALPDGVELRRLRDGVEAEDYWRVAKQAYASIGFPPEVFDHYDDHAGLIAENAVALLAYRSGEPVAIAMTIVNHGVAGIYWVGTTEGARGQGLGRALTATAVNAGFDLGAEFASLQASPMGEPIYRAMGFEKIYDYRLFMAAPPQGSQ
jgi:ribosomal protein S18 acetylase RimI-like enzyme